MPNPRVIGLLTTVDPTMLSRVAEFVHDFFEKTDYRRDRMRILIGSGYPAAKRLARAREVHVDVWKAIPPHAVGANLLRARALSIRSGEGAGPLLIKLDDDLRVRDPGWLQELVDAHQRYPTAILGPKLLYPNGSVQHGGGYLLRHAGGVAGGHYGQTIELGMPILNVERPVEFVTGACLLVPKATAELLGPFDTVMPAWEDSEYCFRARSRGIPTIYVPTSVLTHDEGATRSQRTPSEQQAYMARQGEASRMFLERYRHLVYPAAPG